MNKLSLRKEDRDNFLERYTGYYAIRKLRIQRFLDAGKMGNVIRLLEEGKSTNHTHIRSI